MESRCLINELDEGSELGVLYNGTIMDTFSTNSGVRQRCSLAPLLFAILLDYVMCQFTTRRRGITWFLTRQLEYLDFVDDICLLSLKLTDMQVKVDELVTLARKVGEVKVAEIKALESTTATITS
ncbi:uncharacterized protein LOC128855885 [Anastrepha ludens]|uniref:uncharacterized protein LOC128855885 n=1 Tax=Anastrepha ludens TaxID=28586 RepID=UPI0023B00BBA|nr:uncharacterized protein LOC128855885 [Anastrepha ludens]